MKRLLVVLVALSLPFAAAQLDPVTGVVNKTSPSEKQANSEEGLPVIEQKPSEGFGDKFSDIFGSLFTQMRDLLVSSLKQGIADATAIAEWTQSITVSITTVTFSGIYSGFSSIGAGLALVMVTVASWIGVAAKGLVSGIAMILAAWGSLIAILQPKKMPDWAFDSAVLAGGIVSGSTLTVSAYGALRRFGLIGALPAMAGFSRIQEDELLDHPTRKNIYELIRETPGIHSSELARVVGMGWGTISHHLDKLRKAKMVTLRKLNGQNCYFTHSSMGWTEMEVTGSVRTPQAARIALYIHDHPQANQKDIADALHLSEALASFHTRKLVNQGVLEKTRDGRSNLISLSGEARRLVGRDRQILENWRHVSFESQLA